MGNSNFRICGFVPWHGGVRNIILFHTHTHTSYFLNTSLKTFLFTPLANTVMNRERPTFVEFSSSIPTCIVISSMCFTLGNREFLHGVSLLHQGKSNQNTDISAVVKKCIKFYFLNKWCSRSMPLLLHSCCPKPVQISGLGTGTLLSCARTSQTANLETNIQSGLLLQSWNKW